MAPPSTRTYQPYFYKTEERLPESDGKPMAETDIHRDQMVDSLLGLDDFLRPDPMAYVTGNIFLYYRDDNDERQSVAPDIFVVLGVEKKRRRYYNLEVERKAPDLVIEMVSTNSKLDDLGSKRVLYASLGVREYYVFDPTGEVIKEQLRGFRLEQGDYVPVVGSRLQSQVLKLDLVVEGGKLRFYDRRTGQRLLTHEESEAARRAAEAEVARLRVELAKARGEA